MTAVGMRVSVSLAVPRTRPRTIVHDNELLFTTIYQLAIIFESRNAAPDDVPGWQGR
jgi:hypothetical protein